MASAALSPSPFTHWSKGFDEASLDPILGGTLVGIIAAGVHTSAEYWPEPERFDPLRFTPEATARRHKYAWVPFGGGAHMCLGLHLPTCRSRS